MYDKTVTVFNKYTDKNDAIYWYPHVISGVTLITDKAANIAKTGLDTADTANLHVPFKVCEGERTVCNLSYLTPKVWKTSENRCHLSKTKRVQSHFRQVTSSWKANIRKR